MAIVDVGDGYVVTINAPIGVWGERSYDAYDMADSLLLIAAGLRVRMDGE
jgi:hypothetical protein